MKKNRDNKKFWDRVARLYTPIQEKGNSKMYAKVIEDIIPYLDSNMDVLEIAMGTGQFTFSLCDKVKSFVATDFSPKMIAAAKKLKPEGVTYAVEDATALTYADETFDAVIIANALHIMPNPDKALSEIHRVLKPNGLLIAPTFIYEGDIKKFGLKMMELVGFKSYYEWDRASYIDYVSTRHFSVEDTKLYDAKFGPECLLIARKSK